MKKKTVIPDIGKETRRRNAKRKMGIRQTIVGTKTKQNDLASILNDIIAGQEDKER